MGVVTQEVNIEMLEKLPDGNFVIKYPKVDTYKLIYNEEITVPVTELLFTGVMSEYDELYIFLKGLKSDTVDNKYLNIKAGVLLTEPRLLTSSAGTANAHAYYHIFEYGNHINATGFVDAYSTTTGTTRTDTIYSNTVSNNNNNDLRIYSTVGTIASASRIVIWGVKH